jgi:hypothetical protein
LKFRRLLLDISEQHRVSRLSYPTSDRRAPELPVWLRIWHPTHGGIKSQTQISGFGEQGQRFEVPHLDGAKRLVLYGRHAKLAGEGGITGGSKVRALLGIFKSDWRLS